MRSFRIPISRCVPFVVLAVAGGAVSVLAAQDPPAAPAAPTPAPPQDPRPQSPTQQDPKPPAPQQPAQSSPDAPAAKTSAAEQAKEAARDPKIVRDVAHFNLGDDALAIDGYDPVAYFPEGGGRATRGKDSITYRYRGVLYRFKDTANKDRFAADPAKYEPLYGGWCAYGCAKQDKVEIDPESFLIENGHLMLFYDGFLADTRAKWLEQGSAELKPKADSYWEKVVATKRD